MKQLDMFNTGADKVPEQATEVDKKLSSANEKVSAVASIKKAEPVVEQGNTRGRKKIQRAEKEKTSSATASKRGRKSYKETDVEIALVDVPGDEVLFTKQYYSMGEVAGWFNVNHSLLRLWEKEFDILKPRKNRKGDRLFRPEDVKNLQLIYYLLRNCKFSIEGARQYLKDNKKKADLDMRLIASLTKFRSFLLELRANLQQ